MFDTEKGNSEFYRYSIKEDGKEIARASIFLIKNDLHEKPYGLLEDVFVDEEYRGKGYGKKMMLKILEEAENLGIYKLIGTSRFERESVHAFYESLGFKSHGYEFRIDYQE